MIIIIIIINSSSLDLSLLFVTLSYIPVFTSLYIATNVISLVFN